MGKTKPFMYVTGMISAADLIRPNDIADYRDSVLIGDKLEGPRGIMVTILAKYKHVAITTHGYFQWIDLYMHNVRRVDCTETDYKYYYE